MNFKEDCIHFVERQYSQTDTNGIDLYVPEWCLAKDKFIKKCPKKCSKYDFMLEQN
jgi:hypothetical protein